MKLKNHALLTIQQILYCTLIQIHVCPQNSSTHWGMMILVLDWLKAIIDDESFTDLFTHSYTMEIKRPNARMWPARRAFLPLHCSKKWEMIDSFLAATVETLSQGKRECPSRTLCWYHWMIFFLIFRYLYNFVY